MINCWKTIFNGRSLPAEIGTPGYSLPEISHLTAFSFNELRDPDNSVAVIGSDQATGTVFIPKGKRYDRKIRINVTSKTTDALVILGSDLSLQGSITLAATSQTVVFSGGTSETSHAGNLNAALWGKENCLFIGTSVTMNGCQMVLGGNSTSVILGDDCMLSVGIYIATTDQHGVIDLRKKAIVNHPASVHIEPHVWLGRLVSVSKGARIGRGSVIGANSFVSGHIPKTVIAGGVPAKVIRAEATWDRTMFARQSTLEFVAAADSLEGQGDRGRDIYSVHDDSREK